MAKAPVRKQTKKRKEEIILPGASYIYQSNRITNGRFPDFSTYHIKIFVCLIKQMQEAIKAEMDGKAWQQLGLFEEVDSNYLRIGIPLSEISSPQHYKAVVESFSDLRKIDYNIESPYAKGYVLHTGLIESFETPIKENGKSVIYVKIVKDVAKDLIEISKNQQGKPISFTRYLYEVVMNSSSKYTWKVYTLISSWKAKGGLQISLERFREILGLNPEEYPNYADLKRRVIVPAQKELDHKADCWFECSDKDFEEKSGKKVVGLRFKIITPDLEEVNDLKTQQIIQILREHAGFKQTDIDAIKGLFTAKADYGSITNKVLDLLDYTREHRAEIANPKHYIITSLLNAFDRG
jgi:plasmid replication initiation protein